MDKHLFQARHNEAFLRTLEENFPEDFNDWKITVVFYTCLHYLRAYSYHQGVSIGPDHDSLFKAMKARGLETPNLEISDECLKSYSTIFSVCRGARYNGIDDPGLFETMRRRDLVFCKKKLEKIKGFIESRGCRLTTGMMS